MKLSIIPISILIKFPVLPVSNSTLSSLLEYFFNLVQADVPVVSHLLLDLTPQHLHFPLDTALGVPINKVAELNI